MQLFMVQLYVKYGVLFMILNAKKTPAMISIGMVTIHNRLGNAANLLI